MRKRLIACTSRLLTIVLGVGPVFTLATPSDLINGSKVPATTRVANSIPPPFFSKLLSKRPLQKEGAAQDLPGQSTTVLPDGRVLRIGGLEQNGPVANAEIGDSRTQISGASNRLQRARAWHSATMLPDGIVLIVGGIGGNGQVVDTAELFDPQTQRSELLTPASTATSNFDSRSSITPRVYHTATLITEGIVLIAGGLSSDGDPIKEAQLWDFRAKSATKLRSKLKTGRYNHTASLLADGDVLLSNGTDRNGVGLTTGELFSVVNRRFKSLSSEEVYALTSDLQSSTLNPHLMGSSPEDGATNVSPKTLIAVRFSKLLRVDTVNSDTVILSGPYGRVETEVVPAEAGMLAFITPKAPLFPGASYNVSLSGPTDKENRELSLTSVTFTTAFARLPIEAQDGEEWIPDANNKSDWRTGRADSPWQSLPPLQAAPGVTALAGQVLTLDGKPLNRVTLKIDDRTAQTDMTGRFLVETIAAGHRELVIDGTRPGKRGKNHGVFEAGLEIKGGKTNVLPYTIWLPKIDESNAVEIPSPTTKEVVITTPRIPGLEVHLPPNTVIYDQSHKRVTRVSITPIPVDRPPFPLPAGVQVPIYFTVQPGGAYVKVYGDGPVKGARIIYPNYTYQPPGARANFWHYDPEGRGWYVYGQGAVTADGTQTVPDPGVAIYEFTGAMVSFGGNAPSQGPPCEGTNDGDPVDLYTGLFVLNNLDFVLSDVLPIGLSRTYRPSDTVSRAFGIGATHPYNMFLVGDSLFFTYAELVLPDGGRIRYNRISSGNGYNDAVMEHTATPSAFYKSRLTWNGAGWNITFKDGSVYVLGDSGAPVQSIRDRYGNQIKITRSSGQLGNITRITSPNGKWMQFTYDGSNRITQVTDLIGRSVNYTYDASGRLWKFTDAKGAVTEYTYDSSHRMLTIKDGLGVVYLTNEYDSNGRVSKQTQADASTFQFAYTLDGSGKVTQTDVTDPRGYIRRVTFNSSGYPLTDTYATGRPEQQATTFELQSSTNLILSVTDQLNRRTAYAYDSMGNVTSTTWLSGTAQEVTQSYTYEPLFNELISITDPLNHTTNFGYDSRGSLISVTDPLNHQTSINYNSAGQVVSVTDQEMTTTLFTYDNGELVRITDPLGNSITQFADAAGRVVRLSNELGHTVQLQYDGANRPISVTDPLQGTTSFSHDANNNLLSVTDARNNVIGYAYDNMDRVTTRTDQLGHNDTYTYDASGNLTQVTDRKSQVTSYVYDALNRLAQVTFAGGSTISYTYDSVSRLTQVVDSVSGTLSFGYDDFDRLTTETTPQGTLSYTYDAAGRQTTMTVTGQSAVQYTYDNADRLTQIAQGTSVVSFVYDGADRLTSQTLPNGVISEYTYDDASRLTGISYKKSGTLLGNLSYVYDPAGRQIEMGGSFARTGLPLAVASATYNAANQQVSFGGQTLTYDLNGNLTSDGANTFSWNSRDQLASISGPGLTASFQHDAFDRRTSKAINGTTTGHLYDGADVVQEQAGGSATANIVSGGLDLVFLRTESSGAVSPITDAQGSIIALTDSQGVQQTQYTYEAFGKTNLSGAASANPSQYTGRENDGTGLYYYRARYYSSVLHRFISEDPIGILSGGNAYAYANNNPVSLTDPLGLSPLGDFVGGLIYTLNPFAEPPGAHPFYKGGPPNSFSLPWKVDPNSCAYKAGVKVGIAIAVAEAVAGGVFAAAAAARAARAARAAAKAGRAGAAGARAGAAAAHGGGGAGGRGGSPPIHSRYADGTPVFEGQQPPRISGPVPGANGPHSALRNDGVNGRTYQGREFDGNGHPVRDVDFTSPTDPSGRFYPGHAPPGHQHRWEVNDPRVGPGSGFKREKGGRPL